VADTQRETDRHLFGDGEAFNQEVLDADYAELQEDIEAQDRERSHLYETGDASDAIKSVSKACQSMEKSMDKS
jgi:hypothetical protein